MWDVGCVMWDFGLQILEVELVETRIAEVDLVEILISYVIRVLF